MIFHSEEELRSTSKDIWNRLDEGGEAACQAKAMLAFSGMRQRAAERGYMSDADIEAEIAAVREGKDL